MIQFASIWERLPLKRKKSLLSEAGHSENYANSSFTALPYPVNVDVEYAYTALKGGGL